MMMAHRLTRDLLQTFVPINALSAERLDYLLEGQQVVSLPEGTELCSAGESDGYTIYLLSGEVDIDGDDGRRILSANDPEAAHPLEPSQPRRSTVRAHTSINIIRFDSKRLDRVLAWDQSAGGLERELAELMPAGEDTAWISRLLQSRLFYRLPPSNIIQLFKGLERRLVQRGECVVSQGEHSDSCYFIQQGVAEVRVNGERGPMTVALLEKGQYFGEEGLLTEGPRNADIVMETDGVLLRLNKKDFDALLKAPSLAMVDFATAVEMVEQGEASWLDVRLPDECDRGVLAGAQRLPLQSLRVKARLLPAERRYIVYCDTGRRSAAAAFMLGIFGYEVMVLDSGLRSLMPSERARFLVNE
jgi:CRP-like cAMP-binding protein